MVTEHNMYNSAKFANNTQCVTMGDVNNGNSKKRREILTYGDIDIFGSANNEAHQQRTYNSPNSGQVCLSNIIILLC